jgi:hypothetical protein
MVDALTSASTNTLIHDDCDLIPDIRDLTDLYADHPYVLHRKSLLQRPTPFSQQGFWEQLIMGVLSSQASWGKVTSYLAIDAEIADLGSSIQ